MTKKKDQSTNANPNMANEKDWDKQKVQDHICTTLACSSKGIASILAEGLDGHSLPTYTTIARWLTEDEGFRENYAHAKADQCDFMADEMIGIADTTTDPQKARLQLDTRKWLASKLKPKKYGDKIALEHSGEIETDKRSKDAAVEAALVAAGISQAQNKENE